MAGVDNARLIHALLLQQRTSTSLQDHLRIPSLNVPVVPTSTGADKEDLQALHPPSAQ